MSKEDFDLITEQDFYEYGVSAVDIARLRFLISEYDFNDGDIPQSEHEELEEIDRRIMLLSPRVSKNKLIKLGLWNPGK